jgi:hypothetical protein
VIFVDDFTRYTWIYFLKNKSEVCDTFLQFEKMVDRQFNTKIRAFHSDWGREYKKLHPYFKCTGIQHRISCPYTHEQNGTVERKIRHLVDTCLTLLAHAKLPLKYWNYSLQHSAILINVLPSHSIANISPFKKLFKADPHYLAFQPFGCAIFPLLCPYNTHKFSFRTTPRVYLGQSPLHSAYRCLDPSTGRIYLAKHAKFHAIVFPYTAGLSTSHLPVATSHWLSIAAQHTSNLASPSGLPSSPLGSANSPPSLPLLPRLTASQSSPTPPGLNLCVDLNEYSAPPAPTEPTRTHHMAL